MPNKPGPKPKPEAEKVATMAFSLPKPVAKALRAEAEKRDVPMSRIVAEALQSRWELPPA